MVDSVCLIFVRFLDFLVLKIELNKSKSLPFSELAKKSWMQYVNLSLNVQELNYSSPSSRCWGLAVAATSTFLSLLKFQQVQN